MNIDVNARINKKSTGIAHHMQTPAAENPAFWGLIKPRAKQEGRERNEARDTTHGHSQRYGWLGSIKEGDILIKLFKVLSSPNLIPNTGSTTCLHRQATSYVSVKCISFTGNRFGV